MLEYFDVSLYLLSMFVFFHSCPIRFARSVLYWPPTISLAAVPRRPEWEAPNCQVGVWVLSTCAIVIQGIAFLLALVLVLVLVVAAVNVVLLSLLLPFLVLLSTTSRVIIV